MDLRSQKTSLYYSIHQSAISLPIDVTRVFRLCVQRFILFSIEVKGPGVQSQSAHREHS